MPSHCANVKVFKSRVLPFQVKNVWRELSSFRSPIHWNPGVVDVDIDGDEYTKGCLRNLHIQDGKIFKERLTDLNNDLFAVTYDIVECPMPISEYTSVNRFIPVTSTDHTLAIWESTFCCAKSNVDEMKYYFGVSAYEEGLEGMEDYLNSLSSERS